MLKVLVYALFLTSPLGKLRDTWSCRPTLKKLEVICIPSVLPTPVISPNSRQVFASLTSFKFQVSLLFKCLKVLIDIQMIKLVMISIIIYNILYMRIIFLFIDFLMNLRCLHSRLNLLKVFYLCFFYFLNDELSRDSCQWQVSGRDI